MIWKEKLSAIFRNGTQRRPPGIFGRWFFYRVFTEFLCSVVLVGLRGTFFWSGFFFFGGGGGVSSPASRNPKRRCRVTRTSERIHAGHPRIPFVRHPTCRVLFVFVFFYRVLPGFLSRPSVLVVALAARTVEMSENPCRASEHPRPASEIGAFSVFTEFLPGYLFHRDWFS